MEAESSTAATARSAMSRIPGTDEADVPAIEHEEDRTSGRAEPKPKQESVRVRDSAGRIVEIKLELLEDDVSSITIDELSRAWVILAVEGEDDDEDDMSLE